MLGHDESHHSNVQCRCGDKAQIREMRPGKANAGDLNLLFGAMLLDDDLAFCSLQPNGWLLHGCFIKQFATAAKSFLHNAGSLAEDGHRYQGMAQNCDETKCCWLLALPSKML